MAEWRNWSGLQRSEPSAICIPKDIRELIQIVKVHDKIRVVGAGHSFSPLVSTPDTLVSLDHLQGLIHHDTSTSEAKIWAGTRIYQLLKVFDPINQALQNQGDIDQQSIAGAISTGTHGTGTHLTCLSGLVSEFELLQANGDLVQCNASSNQEIFEAGRVSLGSLGIITKVNLKNRPRYKLKEHIQLRPVKEILQEMDKWRFEHRHIESFIFACHDQALLKTLDETDEKIIHKKAEWPSEDSLLTLCCEATRLIPQSVGFLQKLVGVFVKESVQVNWSGQIFPSVRETKFNEMEYQIPVAQGMACLEEVITTFRRKKLPAFFPLEVRYVKGDDIWISPFYQQDSLSISIHQYIKQDYKEIFSEIEPIFKRYGGRPHWGKLHSLKAKQLQALYPKWEDFQTLRKQLDPTQKFLNPYLEKLFIP